MSREGAKFWWKEDLPDAVAYVSRNHPHEKWVPTTYKDILERKKDNQAYELEAKRRSETYKQAGFVWVFHNHRFLFGGWWVYIKTIKGDHALNFRSSMNKQIVEVMNLFPCGVIPCLDNLYVWADSFAKQYPHKGFKRKKKQGLAKCWVHLDSCGNIHKITDVK